MDGGHHGDAHGGRRGGPEHFGPDRRAFHRVPRVAFVRPRNHRSGTGLARYQQAVARHDDQGWPAQGRNRFDTNDRLPQRLRPAVHGRARVRGRRPFVVPDLARRHRELANPCQAVPRQGKGDGYRNLLRTHLRRLCGWKERNRALRGLGQPRRVRVNQEGAERVRPGCGRCLGCRGSGCCHCCPCPRACRPGDRHGKRRQTAPRHDRARRFRSPAGVRRGEQHHFDASRVRRHPQAQVSAPSCVLSCGK
mmetsp:Transcript_5957/g.22524  ORF Transcript_5957/g.22524 Transcript_5957/m.22524 type:complete len:250 (-) Transcript_5957:136-885(-)